MTEMIDSFMARLSDDHVIVYALYANNTGHRLYITSRHDIPPEIITPAEYKFAKSDYRKAKAVIEDGEDYDNDLG